MGLNLERLQSKPEKPITFFKPEFSEIRAIPLMTEAWTEQRIREIRRILKGKEKRSYQDQQNNSSKDDFEPFVNPPQTTNNPLFINDYNGNFAQQMDLNRRGVENVLKIAHLNGKVNLTSFIGSRKSSSEAHGDELVAKRNFLLGEKIQQDNKENPYKKVVSTPNGWRIEINDRKIMEELGKQNLGINNMQREFIKQFNSQLRSGILECIIKEKLSYIKDKNIILKFISSAFPIWVTVVGRVESRTGEHIDLITQTMFKTAFFIIQNLVINTAYYLLDEKRKTDNALEYMLPQVEIDKVIRSVAFLAGKGRTLIREIKPEIK